MIAVRGGWFNAERLAWELVLKQPLVEQAKQSYNSAIKLLVF
jgi:hypothetical protein